MAQPDRPGPSGGQRGIGSSERWMAQTRSWPPGVGVDNLRRFRSAVAGALAYLEARRREINDLNVFPVADGDTGDNMALTLRAVAAELERLEQEAAQGAVEELDRRQIVESVARAALLGARGNSGVILSQLIRGAAEELSSRPGELIDPALIGSAMLNAVNRAYQSVREPAEGTILTVAREMAQQLVADVAHQPDKVRLAPDAEPQEQDAAIAEALQRALGVGEETLKRGPQLLAVLREAGVVDAGAFGLTVIFAGVISALKGEPPPALAAQAPARVSHPHHSSSTYRYCTNFVVSGEGLDPSRFIAPLEELGDSVLVVGDSHTLKVHLHTDHPDRATAVFEAHGAVSRLDVADMRLQERERRERLEGAGPQLCGVVAVVDGKGLSDLYEELGVLPLAGGPTLNPSTYELLAAIHQVEAEQVIVLPCSPNVVLAAQKAAELAEKEVVVAAALSQQAGIAAAVAINQQLDLQTNLRVAEEAIEALRAGAVGRAARDDPEGRYAEGEAVGLVGERLVASGEPAQALVAVAELLADGAELLTIYTGLEAPLDGREVEALLDGRIDAELELRCGGQCAYWWLLAAE